VTWLERMAAFRAGCDPSEITNAIPYAVFLGLSLERTDQGLLCRMRYADQNVGNPSLPALHGGTLGALLESAAVFQLLWEVEMASLPKIINITAQYLRSARPVDTLARSIITKHGRRVVAVRAEAWQDDPARPVAIANAHFLIRPAGE